MRSKVKPIAAGTVSLVALVAVLAELAYLFGSHGLALGVDLCALSCLAFLLFRRQLGWGEVIALAGVCLVFHGLAWPAISSRPPQPKMETSEAISIQFRCVTQLAVSPSDTVSEWRSADGQVVVQAEGPQFKKTVRLYKTSTNEPVGPTIHLADPGGSFRITALAVSSDNRMIVTAIGNFSNDWGKVVVWNGTTGEAVAEYQGPPYLGEVVALTFSEDDKVVTILCGPAGGK